jgi:hypothetical protein
MRIGLLWTREDAGLYSNAPFDELFAYVGHNNGNLAFVHAIRQHVQAPMAVYGWGTPAATLRREVDLLVMPCANQLGKHSDLGALARTLDAADVPVVAIGLGAQAGKESEDVELTPGTLAWLQALARLRRRRTRPTSPCAGRTPSGRCSGSESTGSCEAAARACSSTLAPTWGWSSRPVRSRCRGPCAWPRRTSSGPSAPTSSSSSSRW